MPRLYGGKLRSSRYAATSAGVNLARAVPLSPRSFSFRPYGTGKLSRHRMLKGGMLKGRMRKAPCALNNSQLQRLEPADLMIERGLRSDRAAPEFAMAANNSATLNPFRLLLRSSCAYGAHGDARSSVPTIADLLPAVRQTARALPGILLLDGGYRPCECLEEGHQVSLLFRTEIEFINQLGLIRAVASATVIEIDYFL